MIRKLYIPLFVLILLVSCDEDPFKPTGTGYTTIQVAEQQEMQCPYCMGSGVQNSFYGPAYCSYCNGTGKRYNTSFRAKQVRTLKRNDKDCPTSTTTFECVDEHNNGIISSTDRCIHCKHMYYVHM